LAFFFGFFPFFRFNTVLYPRLGGFAFFPFFFLTSSGASANADPYSVLRVTQPNRSNFVSSSVLLVRVVQHFVCVGTLVRAPEFEPSILAQQAIAKSEEFA
jgi:hypothetical protein